MDSNAEARRARATRALDQFWPARRGVAVDEKAARAFVLRVNEGRLYPFDFAAQDAQLSDLVGGGLLEYTPCDRPAERAYARPAADFDWAAAEARATANGPMYHPFDGSPPRPYAEVLAEQAAARRAAEERAEAQAAGQERQAEPNTESEVTE